MKKLSTPRGLFNKFLIWTYKTNSNPNTSQHGRSPLDIPGRTVFLSFIASIIFALISGNIFIISIHKLIVNDLTNIEKNQPDIIPNDSNIPDGKRDMAVIDVLLPHEKTKLSDADDAIKNKIINGFSNNKITVSSIAKFIGKEDKIIELRKSIIGETSRPFGFIPLFTPESPDRIADDFGLFKSYPDEIGELDEKSWERLIFISSVQFLRDKLDGGIHHPRRLLTALGGGIQWITFIVAIWCLMLLLVLRIPWSKLQTRLTVENHLPWHKEKNNNVWDLKSEYGYDLDEEINFPRVFIPVRLTKDVNNIINSSSSESVYNLIRERVEAYRNSVEMGEYEIINFLIWATPTFGFIGTIFGIISAMENAAAIFSAATAVEQAIALDRVSGALGTAFDTSFIALIWLVPMSYFLARTKKVEANLFEALEFEATGNLAPQLDKKILKMEVL